MNELVQAIIEMRDADKEYGCGFYNTEKWLAAYRKAIELAEARLEELAS